MPDIHPSVYVAPTAFVVGDVTVGRDSSLWPGASIRGDMGAIRIGQGSSIQDSCTLHVQPGGRVEVGDLVTVGHGVVLHGCSIGDCTVVGMNSTVLDGAKVGRKCIVAAGAVVKSGLVVPDNSMVVGFSEIKEGRVMDANWNWVGAILYIALARQYKKGGMTFDNNELMIVAENLKAEYPLPA